MKGYSFENVRGHVEVYKDGEFIFSADTYTEACKEIMELERGK